MNRWLGGLVIVGCAACGNGSSGGDAGTDAQSDVGGGDASNDVSDDMSMCGPTLCVAGNQAPQCPSCSPSNGDICSPPAAVTCNWTNGCAGAQLQTSQCTCELPDASSDASDAGTNSGTAFWSCQLGM